MNRRERREARRRYWLHQHAQGALATRRYAWVGIFVKRFNTDPDLQYKVHQIGMTFWLLNFPAVTLLYFFAPGLWVKIGLFVTLIYSIYANASTDYGAMSAALAVDRPKHVEGDVSIDNGAPVPIAADVTVKPE